MKTNKEIEYKSQLTETEFNILKDSFAFNEGQLQVNHYFDTSSKELLEQKCMARIRVIDDTFLFTLKIPKDTYVLEREFYLESLDINGTEIVDELASMNIYSPLVEVAVSSTVRYEYEDKWGVWCLDATKFKNHHDYEIEYELHPGENDAYSHYIETLKNLAIEYKPSKPKYIRALESETL